MNKPVDPKMKSAAGQAPIQDLREWLDIDSLDFLNVVIAINERTGVEIPERDYPRLVTLADCVTYLSGVTA